MGAYQLESLIKMANQIADNNSHIRDQDKIAQMVSDHINKFWARSMKQQICEYNNDAEPNQLNPIARSAVNLLTLRKITNPHHTID